MPVLFTASLLVSLTSKTSNSLVLMLENVSLILLLLLIIYYLYSHYNKRTRLPLNYCTFFYLAFIVWASFSVLWSSAQATSLLTLMPFIGGLLALVVAYTYSAEQTKIQMQLLLLLAFLLSILTLYQALILKINRPAGLFLDWNTHAAFLTMVLLPLCGQFLIVQKQQYNSLFMGICCGLLCVAINLTLSRGAFLSLLLGLILISTLALRYKMSIASLLKLYAILATGFLLGEWLNYCYFWALSSA
ncbi:MAG: hypothetical protein NTV00_14320 [Methylococcales bacterium]|nr:hypothetical protein [Methylococcales bacterium]